jgi:CubicO group peptidase (beta-lactamase class C family)
MGYVRAFITAILLMPVAAGVVSSQTPAHTGTPRTVARLVHYLDTLETRGFSGSVLVELDGVPAIVRGYGYRDQKSQVRNTPTTVFDIGSVTKQFTAAAILTLEMKGKLRVEDSLGMYFPDVPRDKTGITLHHLLRHASGLPSTIGRDYDRITRAAFTDSLWRTPLRFAPGTRFSYSNVGYSLLAMIIEKVSGQSFEEYLYANLWKPASMGSTGYLRPAFSPDSIAIGYNRYDDAWGKPTEKLWDTNGPFWHLKGNGGILSTVGDLSRWHHALLGDRILSSAAKVKYYHPALRPEETADSYYAYGWDVHRTPWNTVVIQHNGANGIFYADFSRYLAEDVTIITMSNHMHPNFTGLNGELARMIFDTAYTPPYPVADTRNNRSFTDTILTLAAKEGARAAINAYAVRDRGLELIEFQMNERGYALLGEKKVLEAIEVFLVTTHAFPLSGNAFDSLGEAYMAAGMKEPAIENYRRSLALDPGNGNAEEMLKTLTRK